MSAQLDTRLLRFRSKPGSEDAARLATDLLENDRAAEATEVTAAGLRASPDDLSLLVLDGRAHLVGGDLLRAQAALLKAARLAPAQKEPFRWLGEVLLKRGDPARALKVLERAKAIDATDLVITTLHDRAVRLAHIASTQGEAAAADAARAAFEPSREEHEARTVVRPEISSALAAGTTPEPPAWDDEDGETAAKVAHPPAGNEDDEVTSPELDDEEATSLMDRADLALATAAKNASGGKNAPAARGAAGQAPPARPARKATLAFGSALGAKPPAPAQKPTNAAARPGRPDPFAAPVAKEDPFAAPARPSPRQAAAPDPFATPAGAPDPFAAPAGGPDPFAAASAPVPAAAVPPAAVPTAAVPPAAVPPAAVAPRELPRPAPLPNAAILSPPQAAPEPPRAPMASAAMAPAPEPTRPYAERPYAEPAPTLEAPPGIADAELMDVDAIPPPEPDLAVGEHAGQGEDVDEVLTLLEREGIFEPPGSQQGAGWTAYAESRPERTRIGVILASVWVLAIGVAVGGWFGFHAWVDMNHARAGELVDQARTEALAGDHERLVDAERHLREARDLYATDTRNPTVLLFVLCQRALEDGEFEAGYLRAPLARAERIGADEAWLHAARAVLAAADGDRDEAMSEIGQALEADGDDAGLLYVAGRIEQRFGGEQALAHLEDAVRREPELAAAAMALAEARYDEGQYDDALTLLTRVLEHDDRNLRAELWRRFLTADEGEPDAALSEIEGEHERIEMHGAPTDEVLYQLTRARLLRRQGQLEQAGEAIETALSSGAQEPRLLALMAQAARAAGRMVQAEFAANAAVRGSPGNVEFRKLLASIYLDRRQGARALATIAELPADDPDVLAMSARASLLVDTDAAIAAAIAAVDAYIAEHEDAGVELRTLRVRLAAASGDAAGALSAAQQLARDNPGDPVVNMALGEAALAAGDPEVAVRALEVVARASSDDADAHWMLGRARRMAGSADDARASFERAIEINPQHAEARLALGTLLLDTGAFAEADTLYTEIGRSGGTAGGLPLTVAGRLGRIEALIGLARLDDAQVQLEGVTADLRETATVRITAARLALARGRAGDAIRELTPLLGGERVSATVRAMQGDALLAAGEVDAAAAAYEQALELDAGLPEALLGRAELLVRAEHGDDAEPFLARVGTALGQRIRPPSFRARLRYLEGRIALQDERLEVARAKLREASEIEGVPPECFFFLGEALAGDNAPAATEAYQRYLELAPEGSYASRARRATSSGR